MNISRRQFIKRAGAFLAGLPLFGAALRGATNGTPVTSLASLPLGASERGVGGRQVIEGIAAGLRDREEIERIARTLDDGSPVAERLDQFGKACAAQRSELAETYSGFSWPVEEAVSRILAANLGMTHEQAFLQAVMETAESAT